MAKTAKFVHITSSSTEDGDFLYALDEAGDVWCFNMEDERWERLSDERFEGSADEGDEA